MISQFKENAKDSLRGNWGNAIIVFLGIYFLGSLIGSIPNYIFTPNIFNELSVFESMETFDAENIINILINSFGFIFIFQVLISIFVIGVLQLGYPRFSINLALTDKADPDVIFDGFKMNYFTNVKALLWKGVFSFLWQIPSIILYIIGFYFAYNENELALLFYLLGTIAMFVAIVKVLRYTFVPYLLMDNDVHFDTAREYVTESVRIMKGAVLQLILLGFSFILWIFVLIITLGFGIIYLGPYMQQTYANFYLYHKELKNIA